MNTGVIGVDESGKGDYFGPLVIAAVYADEQIEKKFKELRVRDSKMISDNVVLNLSKIIKESAPHSVVVVNPEKYNELYGRIKNLNKLLAWGHARVIENLLAKIDCKQVISDKFGSEKFIKNALMEKGKQAVLKQEVRAEKYPAVAAASILARAEFLSGLKELSGEYGVKLLKGASLEVEKLAAGIVEKHGSDILNKIAKVHFKTTKKILKGN
jgi:ribonuclease HIII